MSITYQLTEEDYIGFNLDYLKCQKSYLIQMILLRYVCPVLLGGVAYYIGTKIFLQSALYWILVAIIYAVVWIIKFPKQYLKYVKKAVIKQLKKQPTETLFEQKTLTILDDRLVISGQVETEVLNQADIKMIHVSDELMMLFISERVAHLIPRRALQQEDEFNILALQS